MKKIVPPDAILIPDNATKVFSGVIFDVYQWPQEMFDGTTETFEMLRRADTVEVLAIKNNKLILIEDDQPHRGKKLCFPGGRTETEDESWEAAARREMLEETGMSFKTWRLLDVIQPQPKIEWFGLWYIAMDFENQTEQSLERGGERIVVKEFDFKDIKRQIMSDFYPELAYVKPLLRRFSSLEELVGSSLFMGNIIER